MKFSSIKREGWTNIIASLFILLFVYTGITKLMELEKFERTIKTSPLLKTFEGFAWVIPFLELAISIALFFPASRRIGFISSAALMFLFTAYIGYMLLTASKLPCSCGGIMEGLSWKSHLWVNGGLTLLAITAAWQQHKTNFLLQ